MNYGLFFTDFQTGKGISTSRILRIPVNPKEYKIKYPGGNSRYNVLDLGEIIQSRLPGLREISWEGIFPGGPDHPGVATTGGFLGPKDYIAAITDFQRSGRPVQFKAVRCLEDGKPLFHDTIDVIVTDFEITEKGGETGDFYYSIHLVEYRDYKPLVLKVDMPTEETIGIESVPLVAEPQRPIPANQIYVGCKVIINGRYYADSYGGGSSGTATNRSGTVSRIITTDPQRPYPIHVKGENGGALGWLKRDQLQVIVE